MYAIRSYYESVDQLKQLLRELTDLLLQAPEEISVHFIPHTFSV